MRTALSIRRVFVSLLAGLAFSSPDGDRLLHAEGIPRRADAPQPLSPAESSKSFQLSPGLRIELVAAEPLIADPTAIAQDASGRFFVCELHGYNLEGHLEIQELNKSGVLDREVRRVRVEGKALEEARRQTFGTVKQLRDTDGDGRMDEASTWADRLPPCYGLTPFRDGVIVVCAPDILFLADRDSDGQAEVRETLLTGFQLEVIERGINNPCWGIDNWIYVAAGGGGGEITGPFLAEPVMIGHTDFRFRPDGTAIEPLTGTCTTFGHAQNDLADRFLISTSRHALYATPLPYRYLKRNPYIASPSPVANAADYTRIYPTSQPHPWRLERGQQEAWRRFYGAHETSAGNFTSACSPLFYRADALPDEYRGNHFSCEPSQNLVHRCLVEPVGLGYRARRAPGETDSEFLTSTDRWFRPINLSIGPDGAIYIVDMYREIIEDYSAIPRYLQQQFGLVEGKDHGRIWRVIREGAARTEESHTVDPADASTDALITLLSDPNIWWRQTAQRLLIERAENAAAEPLAALVQYGKTPQTRLHALYALDGLGALEPGTVETALHDPHHSVRIHATRSCERWLAGHRAIRQAVLGLVDDPNPRVRLQLALTLGESDDPQAREALVQLAAQDGADAWMRAAIISSIAPAADQLLVAILDGPNPAGHSGQLVSPLAATVGARRQDTEIDCVLTAVAEKSGANASAVQVACLQGLVDGLGHGKPRAIESTAAARVIPSLLREPSHEVRSLTFKLVAAMKLGESPEMRSAFAEAGKAALDGELPVDARLTAIRLLSSAPYATLSAAGKQLLDPRVPVEVQLAAVEAMAAGADPQVAADLLVGWSGQSPKVQAAILIAIFNRADRLPVLLSAIEGGTVESKRLDALHRIQLLENADPTIRERAERCLAKRSGTAPELLDRYRRALSEPRDVARGEAAFTKVCATCHQLGDRGFAVGPDLATVVNRPDEALLLDILDPNRQIASGFSSYAIVDARGRMFSGVLAAETATSITLRRDEGKQQTILRKDIDEITATSLSLMPEKIDQELSPADVANLLAYLRKSLGQASPSATVLFDDDATFPELLKDGSGIATIDRTDAFSGTAALVIQPFQCHSRQIPGWEYRITERPVPGEFRYIRLAWKTRGGDGVMIELAADGGWPPAGTPLRRYYSGRNTTDWAATQVSKRRPIEWTVVTRDLFQDFGSFTLTGIAPTALGGEAMFDRIELLRTLDDVDRAEAKHLSPER